MPKDGSQSDKPSMVNWLLAELTYKCPLQCPYCYNPTDFSDYLQKELTTEEWINVFKQGREMGAVQLGLSGGEPLVRRDLEDLIKAAKDLGYYSNLITSTLGMDEKRLKAFKKNGLDNIQVSFQASKENINDYFAGTKSFEHKVQMAKLVKSYDFPLVFNIVLHKQNIDDIQAILDMAIELDADYIELANTQYYGFGLENRLALMPTREQLEKAEKIAHKYQKQYEGKKSIYYIIPDYYENRPKPCMNGWGSIFLTITPTGIALPCHSARVIKELDFPNVREHELQWIWEDSPAFNAFRGESWMKSPCRTCPERTKDFGGCRCQAYMLTGDAAKADPVCDLSPDHHIILKAREEAKSDVTEIPLVFRNTKNSKKIAKRLKNGD